MTDYRRTSSPIYIQNSAFLVAAGVAVVLCLVFTFKGVTEDTNAGTIELQYYINPNDASPASLARLPGVGAVRAQAIVTYREKFRESGSGEPAFRDCDDLQKVKGIGPKTARSACEWLRFD